MFQQIGEWYSTTALKTDDQKLTARKVAGEALITAWNKAQFPELLQAVAYGLELLQPLVQTSNPAGALVCAAIVDAQPSFAVETEGPTLDPRLCALVALSEYLNRRLNKAAAWRRLEREVVMAEAIVSALRFRELTAGDFLNQRLNGLYAMAANLLDRMDESRRVRRSNPQAALAALKTKTDVAGIRDAMVEALQTVSSDVELDREELQALWWVFGGVSRKGERFKLMSPGTAAITAGFDLANITRWPGTIGIGALAARACATDAAFEIETLPADTAGQLLPAGKRAIVRGSPSLFPLLVLVADRADSGEPSSSSMRAGLLVGDAAQQAYGEFSLLGILG